MVKADPKIFKEKRQKDSLTGCYTRGYILARLEKILAQKNPFTLFVIDLNKFKNINDLQGHCVGDAVLQKIGVRLNLLGNKEVMIARIGGDEFLAVYLGRDTDRINEIGRKIHGTIQEKIIYAHFEYEITASIGIARFPDDGKEISDLLTLADFAMYHAKQNNLRNHFLITDALSKKMARRQKIKSLLKTIDYDHDLSLRFQPQFDVQKKRVIGVEAIVQWDHKEEGTLYRSEFLPVAKEMGIIQYITKWLFLKSMAQIRDWNETYKCNLCMNINVSQSCIYHRIFFSNVSTMVETYGIQPKWFGISLNEQSVMFAPEYMKKLLSDISEMGINISIHNFGSGMIRLGDIKHLFIDRINIGPDIIQDCSNDEKKLQTLRGILMLAKGMELKTIANGVMTKEQYEILTELGYDSIQGNYLEKPMLGTEFEEKYLLPSRSAS